MRTDDVWPAGATWVFQGTVAEDATAGTHVSSLTVSPGAGSELEVLYGLITVGATATAQTPRVLIDDGTNEITILIPAGIGITTSGLVVGFPTSSYNLAVGTSASTQGAPRILVSGTMRLILRVSTTAVSVTQTFAVACRIKGGTLPTATLADTVGVPTLTTNTNKVF